MNEVIAERSKGILASAIAMAVCGVIFLIIGCCLIKSAMEQGVYLPVIILAAFAVLCLAFAVSFIISFTRIPKVIVSRENDNLIFPDGTCKISEVTNVTVKFAQARYMTYSWGTLFVFINGVKHKYKYVADLTNVQAKLLAICMDYKKNAEAAPTSGF